MAEVRREAPASAMAVMWPMPAGPPMPALAVMVPPAPRPTVVFDDRYPHDRSPERAYLTWLEAMGFVDTTAGLDEALIGGRGSALRCTRKGDVEVVLRTGLVLFVGRIALVGRRGRTWVNAGVDQGAVMVLCGPGVSLDLKRGRAAIDEEPGVRGLLAPFELLPSLPPR